ncbi:MAG: hypothetical protein NVS9B4_15900 [Candidatus Acidiferrum sp.]
MSSALSAIIADLSSAELRVRNAAASAIYRIGRARAERATGVWWNNPELAGLLLAPNPVMTVGVAVEPRTFARIHAAHGAPRMAQAPPDQDALEFAMHVAGGARVEVLTTREPGGTGAIARYLAKLGEGVQQVEFQCADVERAATILKEKFGVGAVYPQARIGADDRRVNFFLVPCGQDKALIELYELPATLR